MKLRLLLLLPPIALAVPAPAAPASPIYGRFCGGSGAPMRPEDMPRKEPCPVACHAALCERSRKGK